jgi:UDP-N-acetylglucosamine--dolichyl-phosphate N-acetylglucosaminephosphotransferase
LFGDFLALIFIFQIISMIIAFLGVTITMPPFIKRMHEQNLIGKDMNKFDKPPVAELGGVIVFFGFSLGILTAIFLSTYLKVFPLNLSILLGGLCTITIISMIGLIDDVIGWKKGIRQWQHALFPIIAALPLMAIQAGETTINLPITGPIDVGIIYSLILIPIGVTGASNATNMLAGLNGLEAGLSGLIIAALGLVALVNGRIEALILALAMIGALIAFSKFNWKPAKIFGGDSLTLMCGATIAVITIVGNMEKVGVALMILFFIEFFLKAKKKFQGESFGTPQKNGLLVSPKEKQSLTHYAMDLKIFGITIFKPTTEDKVVTRLLTIQAAICLVVLTYYIGPKLIAILI